jgi:hypothetical protein
LMGEGRVGLGPLGLERVRQAQADSSLLHRPARRRRTVRQAPPAPTAPVWAARTASRPAGPARVPERAQARPAGMARKAGSCPSATGAPRTSPASWGAPLPKSVPRAAGSARAPWQPPLEGPGPEGREPEPESRGARGRSALISAADRKTPACELGCRLPAPGAHTAPVRAMRREEGLGLEQAPAPVLRSWAGTA